MSPDLRDPKIWDPGGSWACRRKNSGADAQRYFNRARFTEAKVKVHSQNRMRVGNLTIQSNAPGSQVSSIFNELMESGC
jgi:hypothetical protein